MCGRYTLTRMKGLGKTFGEIGGEARYNIAPTQKVVVRTGAGDQPELLRWGLIPSWAKDEKIGYSLINARCETVVAKPAFREAMAKRRCLVAADGFYEWRKNPDGTKTPMYIRMKGGEPFAFAGLWETWRNPTGEVVRSCTIVTTTANSLMAGIHDRMPVILGEADYDKWLGTGLVGATEAAGLLVPFGVEGMDAYPVSTRVNNVRNEGAELLLPEPKEVAALQTRPQGAGSGQAGLFDQT
jgi:putative SOS response-associated peptidase YedK